MDHVLDCTMAGLAEAVTCARRGSAGGLRRGMGEVKGRQVCRKIGSGQEHE